MCIMYLDLLPIKMSKNYVYVTSDNDVAFKFMQICHFLNSFIIRAYFYIIK